MIPARREDLAMVVREAIKHVRSDANDHCIYCVAGTDTIEQVVKVVPLEWWDDWYTFVELIKELGTELDAEIDQ